MNSRHLNKSFFEKGKIMDKNIALTVAGIVFAIVALFHLARLLTKFDLTVVKKIPLWVNLVGVIVAASLAIWMFKSAAY